MRIRTVIMGVTLTAAVTFGAFAGDELLGRDVAREGSVETHSGTLTHETDEWFLEVEDRVFELHMGILGHEGELPFAEGAAATAHGFTIADHIAPITIVTAGETFTFWQADRYPLWAGSGARRNAVDTENPRDAESADDIGARRISLGRTADTTATGAAIDDAPTVAGGFGRVDDEPRYRNQDSRPGRGR